MKDPDDAREGAAVGPAQADQVVTAKPSMLQGSAPSQEDPVLATMVPCPSKHEPEPQAGPLRSLKQ